MKKLFQSVLALSLMVILSNGLSAQQAVVPAGDDAFGDASALPSFAKSGPVQPMGQWTTGAKLPVPKKWHTVASYNGEIYIFTGLTTSNYYNAKCFKYTPAGNTWTPLADFPAAKFLRAKAETVNGKIYICGAMDYNTSGAYYTIPDMYEYNPATDTYTKKTSMPIAQGHCATGVIDNKIYYIGGNGTTSAIFLKTVQVYDPATDTWSTATDYPRDVCYTAAATVSNKIIVSCGFNSTYTPSRYIGDTYVGSVTGGTLTWTKVKDYPIGPTIYPSAAAAGNFAYFVGGRPSIDANAPATQRSFKYELATDTWTTLELKPTGMQNCVQAGTDGQRIYVPGGELGDASYTPSDAFDILDANVAGAPVLFMKSTAIDEWVKKGATRSFPFPFKNNGTADLTWSIAIDAQAASWLSASATSGSVPSFGSGKFDLIVNSASLAPGVQNANVTFTCNDPSNQTKTITVTLHVQNEDVDTDINVLMEEGTGTWCGYCPYGADSLRAVMAQFPGRAYGIAYHGGSTTEPLKIPTVDTWASLTQLQGWPNGAVNRIKFEGNSYICISRGEWGYRIRQVLDSLRSPVTINVLSASYSRNTRQISVDIEVLFHRDLQRQVRLNIAQVQDSLNYSQVFYPASGGSTKLYPYFHNHVLRQMIPNDFGEPLTGLSVTSQTRVTKSFTFTSLDSLRELSRLIVFAHYSDGTAYGQVLQTKEIDLENMITGIDKPTSSDFSLSQNYPNPFSGSSVIEYSVPTTTNVQLVVTDMLGREVARLVNSTVAPGRYAAQFVAGELPAGLYQVTMRTGNHVQTRTMSLLK
jgi:N-acetylneuraminic acid mutarotase